MDVEFHQNQVFYDLFTIFDLYQLFTMTRILILYSLIHLLIRLVIILSILYNKTYSLNNEDYHDMVVKMMDNASIH